MFEAACGQGHDCEGVKSEVDVAAATLLKKSVGDGPRGQNSRIEVRKCQEGPTSRFQAAVLARVIAPSSVGIAAGLQKPPEGVYFG
jgi:hypothetical protein